VLVEDPEPPVLRLEPPWPNRDVEDEPVLVRVVSVDPVDEVPREPPKERVPVVEEPPPSRLDDPRLRPYFEPPVEVPVVPEPPRLPPNDPVLPPPVVVVRLPPLYRDPVVPVSPGFVR